MNKPICSSLRSIFSFCRMFFYNTLCKLWIELFGEEDNRDLKYKVSLCLIFKNEAPFLKEWLDYHLTVGADHFYLYNNNSSDNYLDVIQPYIDKGVITLIDFPFEYAQIEAYKHCFQNYRSESNWISFLDADEFICLRYKDTISDWLQDFSKYPAVNIHWLMFGTGGKLKHDYSQGVLEQYTICWEDLYKHGKCFINTRYNIANFDSSCVHHHTYMHMRIFGLNMVVPAVNQFGYICTIDKTWGGGKNKLNSSTIQINHYFTKSWDIWYNKMMKSDVYYKKNPKRDFSYFDRYESKNISCNHTIFRFLIRMKRNQGIVDA